MSIIDISRNSTLGDRYRLYNQMAIKSYNLSVSTPNVLQQLTSESYGIPLDYIVSSANSGNEENVIENRVRLILNKIVKPQEIEGVINYLLLNNDLTTFIEYGRNIKPRGRRLLTYKEFTDEFESITNKLYRNRIEKKLKGVQGLPPIDTLKKDYLEFSEKRKMGLAPRSLASLPSLEKPYDDTFIPAKKSGYALTEREQENFVKKRQDAIKKELEDVNKIKKKEIELFQKLVKQEKAKPGKLDTKLVETLERQLKKDIKIKDNIMEEVKQQRKELIEPIRTRDAFDKDYVIEKGFNTAKEALGRLLTFRAPATAHNVEVLEKEESEISPRIMAQLEHLEGDRKEGLTPTEYHNLPIPTPPKYSESLTINQARTRSAKNMVRKVLNTGKLTKPFQDALDRDPQLFAEYNRILEKETKKLERDKKRLERTETLPPSVLRNLIYDETNPEDYGAIIDAITANNNETDRLRRERGTGMITFKVQGGRIYHNLKELIRKGEIEAGNDSDLLRTGRSVGVMPHRRIRKR